MSEEFAVPTSPSGGRLSRLPQPVKELLLKIYWLAYDGRDYVAEIGCRIPSNRIRLLILRILGAKVGQKTSVHRNCRVYLPTRLGIGDHTIVNRDVLLDARMGLTIGENVSISEGCMILSLEHDPNSPSFDNRGAAVDIQDYVFIGSRATILPGITLEKGAVVGAGAVVTKNVAPYQIVAGVPAKVIGERSKDLTYKLDYRKFLG